MKSVTQSFSMALLAWTLVAAATGSTVAQPWHSLGTPPTNTPICVLFLNNQLGFVGGFAPDSVNAIVFTRNGGKSWTGGHTPSKLTNFTVYNIRTFDRRILYATVSEANTVSYLLKSLDSGATWSFDSSNGQRITSNRPCYDIYLDSRGAPTLLPDLLGSTVSRFDRGNYLMAIDDDQGPPRYSNDSAVTWQQGTPTDPAARSDQGFGVYADTVSGIGYAIGEFTKPILEATTDRGKTWFVKSYTLPGGFQVDNLEGENDHLYVQTDIGISRTDDGGNTWINLGGPALTLDDRRFSVLGCDGLCVVAFDLAGSLWMMGDFDARTAPTLPNAIQDLQPPCDSGGRLIVRFASVRPPVRVNLAVQADTLHQYTLIGSSQITITDTGTVVEVDYNFKDLNSHRAYLSIIAPDSSLCSSATIPLVIPSRTVSWAINAPQLVGACGTITFPIAVRNPNCDRIELKLVQVTSSQGGTLKPLAFDSVINGGTTDSLPFFFIPPGQVTTGNYTVHLRAYLEPIHILFDTTITVRISSSHVPSQLLAASSAVTIPPVQACTTIDTVIHFKNTGCDTLTVTLDQLNVQYPWTVTPNTGTVQVLPGTELPIHVQLAATKAGAYFLRLKYPYSGGAIPDVTTMDITTTVLPPKITYALSDPQVDFGSRTLCSPDSIVTLLLTNSSCDSVHFLNSLASGQQGFTISDALDTVLPSGGTLTVLIHFHSATKGIHREKLLIHSYLPDGLNTADSAVGLTCTVVRSTAILAASVGRVDLGILPSCEELDSALLISNIGCDTVCISSITMAGTGFTFLNRSDSASCLPPGGTERLVFASALDSTMHQASDNAIITVSSDADQPLQPITLSRGILYPSNWHLSLKPEASAPAPTPVAIDLLQQGSLPPDATAIDFMLSYNADLLALHTVDQANVSVGGVVRGVDNIGHQSVHISPVTPGATLATFRFYTYVTASPTTELTITGLQVTTPDGRPQDCIATLSIDSETFTQPTLCGDPEQENMMRGLPIVFDQVSPNPTGGELLIRYTSRLRSEGRIQVEDVLGRLVLDLPEQLVVGERSRAISVDQLAAGYYDIRITTSVGAAHARFIKE